jgi:hypothetical protein
MIARSLNPSGPFLSPMRPLNYDYLKILPPASQRFYEIVSYKVFAALKHRLPQAKLSYSDFCTFSAIQRYHDYDHFKKQMYKVHKPHIDSGYVSKVHYQSNLDLTGNSDWMMFYDPGPRALAEFATFGRKRAPLLFIPGAPEVPVGEPETEEDSENARCAGDPAANLYDELTRRGITQQQARRLLENAPADQPIAEQLAWGDQLIAQNHGRIYNPPGFYVYLIREKVLPPSEFLTTLRNNRTSSPMAPSAQDDPALRVAYEEYQRDEVEHYIEVHYPGELYSAVLAEKEKQVKKQFRSAALWTRENLREVAAGVLRPEVADQIPFIPFQDFQGDPVIPKK